MGVSKLDVRLVVHETVSKSVAGYYQESGRAGRDLKEATCILYFAPNDVPRLAALGIESPNTITHLQQVLHNIVIAI